MKIAMLYDDDAYLELPDRQLGAKDRRKGLWGRHVAGKEFLDAFLEHGTWEELVAVIRNRSSRDSIIRRCQNHPSSRSQQRRLQIVHEAKFHESFFPKPPASVLYVPQPPDPKYAWVRQHGGPASFAICGVTHTLCTVQANRWLTSLITAPFEDYDTLICTSRAVIQMVRDLVAVYTDFLKDRFGGDPRLKVNLERVPLGVNTDKFRPSTPDEKASQRHKLGIAADEVVVLFVGRMSAHSKVHPYPMYAGVAEAARRTGARIRLLISGWSENESIREAYLDGGRHFAENVQVTLLDGMRSELRYGAWQAADIFTSLSDNIQETFGLVIVEAMAAGLPVVASDWNGYRDLVEHRETGYLVPTAMIRGATVNNTSRLVFGELNYARFLGECNQATIVDNAAAADALTRLVAEPSLRLRMGEAGRKLALKRFAWTHVVRAYESIWCQQDQERRRHLAKITQKSVAVAGPACYAAPEHSFAGYPTQWLTGDSCVVAPPHADRRLDSLLKLPITNYSANRRATDSALLLAAIQQARQPCSLDELTQRFLASGLCREAADKTLAWMLKYDLLQLVEAGQDD